MAKMYSSYSQRSTILQIILLFCCLSACCLTTILGATKFKYLIFILTILTIAISIKKLLEPVFLSEIRSFSLYWLPWIFCVIVLMFVHGTKGLTQYINAFLVSIFLFSALYTYKLTRKNLVVYLSFVLLMLNLAITIDLYRHGVTGEILYTNRNQLIDVVSYMTIAIFSVLFVNKKLFNSKELFLVIFSGLTSLVLIILTEVRQAILPFAAAACVFLVFGNKDTRKISLVFTCLFLLLIIASYMSGRLQTGIEDLNQFNKGNSYTSWGLRIEMWKMVLQAFPLKPIFGWGNDATNAMAEQGIIFPISTWKMAHFHSDFFIALATGGLTMVLGWLLALVGFVKSSLRDLPRMCTLASILACGLADQNWFEQNMLIPFVILWTLLYLTDPARKEQPV